MKQRFLCIAIVLVILVMILGACGGGSSSSSTSIDSAPAEEGETGTSNTASETQDNSYSETEVYEVEDTYTVDELVMMIESGELSLDDVYMQVANGEINESEDVLYEVENIIAEFAGKPPVENVGFEVGEGYQYYLYDLHNLKVPVLGMNFPYGWYNGGRKTTGFDGIECVFEYQFHADLSLVNRPDYGYFTNSKGGLTYLYISTDAECYFGRDYYQVELQINDEYTVDTPYGQWTVQQVILWQDLPEIFEPDETKTVDGTDWYGYYAEVSMINNGGHGICIWLKYSDKDSTYLKDIFTDIL